MVSNDRNRSLGGLARGLDALRLRVRVVLHALNVHREGTFVHGDDELSAPDGQDKLELVGTWLCASEDTSGTSTWKLQTDYTVVTEDGHAWPNPWPVQLVRQYQGSSPPYEFTATEANPICSP